MFPSTLLGQTTPERAYGIVLQRFTIKLWVFEGAYSTAHDLIYTTASVESGWSSYMILDFWAKQTPLFGAVKLRRPMSVL